jgi:hypothetical protein
MRPLSIVASLLALAIAGQAAAIPIGDNGWSFVPANENFAGTGTMSFAISGQTTVNCNVTLQGKTGNYGPATITFASFSDNGDGSCADVKPLDKAWYLNPTSPSIAHWLHFGVILSPKGIKCGKTDPKFLVSDGYLIIDAPLPSPAGVCTVTGSINAGNLVIAKTPGT